MRFFNLILVFILASSYGVFAQNYQQGRLLAKFKNTSSEKSANPDLLKTFSTLDIKSINPIDDLLLQAKTNKNSSLRKSHIEGLNDLLYNNTNIPPVDACSQLMATGAFEYVEPHYVYGLLHVPNDPFSDTTQPTFDADYLVKHRAFEGWEIEEGDTNVVIGIVDNGFLLSHEDLINQVKYNPADTLGNGINDDGDFFYYDGTAYPLVDNYAGWDIADFDNDVSLPGAGIDPHGTKVAGCSSAEHDNSLGIAGTGFKCKFLPIKASTDANPYGIQFGFFGMILAAQQGCQIINLSWGSPNTYSQGIQDLINELVEFYDVTIVAAAGNTPNEYANYYPACYDNVISVGATRIGNSQYGKVSYFTDLNGLGRNVRMTDGSTIDSYTITHGSSYSAPMVAGAIALVRSQRPHLNAIQAGEQVRVTGDVVDTLDYTIQYKDQMGRSLNIYKALTDSTLPSVRVVGHKMATKNGFLTYTGDSITVSVDFINYLTTTTSTDVELSIISNNAEMVDSVFNLGSINTLDSAFQDFTYYLYSGATAGDSVLFRAGFSDGDYIDYQYFVWIVEDNTDIITHIDPTIREDQLITAVYPNPFHQDLFFSTKKPLTTPLNYRVSDLESKIVYESTLETAGMKNKLPLPILSSGMYILTIQTPQRKYHYKIVKL